MTDKTNDEIVATWKANGLSDGIVDYIVKHSTPSVMIDLVFITHLFTCIRCSHSFSKGFLQGWISETNCTKCYNNYVINESLKGK